MPLTWTVLNEGSFASVRVQIPGNACLNCESDAVVTMSEGITVSGHMAGGILSSMLRSFVSNESFFTTLIDNTSVRSGDVLLAPSEPGGVSLHRLYGSGGDDILLTSGSYLASDTTVDVNTVAQRGMKNSLLSGTGLFLMRASGSGVVALSSFGSIHKYTLLSGERRIVDNGHLVAWTARMEYRTRMASSSVWGSVSSGEGLMCEFTGPGTIYLQSHKPIVKDGEGSKAQGSNTSPFAAFIVMMIFFFILSMFAYLVVADGFQNEKRTVYMSTGHMPTMPPRQRNTIGEF